MSVPSTLPPVAAEGGQGSVPVTVAAECVWSVSSEAAWISITSPTTGQGSGTITFVAADNPTAAVRRGALAVSQRRVELMQAGATCDYALDHPAASVEASGGEGAVNVTTLPGCEWTASSNAPWLSIVGTPEGVGAGTLRFRVDTNDGDARVGTLRIAERVFIVSQDGAPSTCALTLSKRTQTVPASGGTDTLFVRGSPQCSWIAMSQAPWIVVASGFAGSGDGTITLTIAPNDGPLRVGVVVVAGQTYSITQAASPTANCSYTVASGQSIGASGGAATIVVSTMPGCQWSAETHATWISIVTGQNGEGSGAVMLQVEPNRGAQRVATITVAGHRHVVTQQAVAGTGCSYTLSETQHSAHPAGGTASVDVTTGADCPWAASSGETWITVTTGATGIGSGRVSLTIAANGGGARSGSVNIAGQTYAVTQSAAAASCSFDLSDTDQDVSAVGGPAAVDVLAPAGCGWTASSQASWITVASGANGSGNGTVVLMIAANTGAQRTGTVNAAGRTHTIRQGAALISCSYSLGSSSASVPASGGSIFVGMTTQPGCTWAAASHASWITVRSGSSGAGSGIVDLDVAWNSGSERVGSVTIGGETFTVTQAAVAAVCTYSLSPVTQTVPLLGGSYSVVVTTQGGCSWTALADSHWIDITANGSGSGSGTIAYSVTLALLPRSGRITIAGQVFTVNQTSLLP